MRRIVEIRAILSALENEQDSQKRSALQVRLARLQDKRLFVEDCIKEERFNFSQDSEELHKDIYKLTELLDQIEKKQLDLMTLEQLQKTAANSNSNSNTNTNTNTNFIIRSKKISELHAELIALDSRFSELVAEEATCRPITLVQSATARSILFDRYRKLFLAAIGDEQPPELNEQEKSRLIKARMMTTEDEERELVEEARKSVDSARESVDTVGKLFESIECLSTTVNELTTGDLPITDPESMGKLNELKQHVATINENRSNPELLVGALKSFVLFCDQNKAALSRDPRPTMRKIADHLLRALTAAVAVLSFKEKANDLRQKWGIDKPPTTLYGRLFQNAKKGRLIVPPFKLREGGEPRLISLGG